MFTNTNLTSFKRMNALLYYIYDVKHHHNDTVV